MSDPFAGGKDRNGNAEFWAAADDSRRLVAKLDKVFTGKSGQEFAVMVDGIEYRTTDHKAIRLVDGVMMNTLECPVRSSDVGAFVVVTTDGYREHQGRQYRKYAVRVITDADGRARVAQKLAADSKDLPADGSVR